MVITRDGAAAVVVVDMAEFEGMKESILLTRILAMGLEDVAKGDTVALDVVERRFEARFETAG